MFNLLIVIFLIQFVTSNESNNVNSKNLCPYGCPKIILPVCGYDGKMYKMFQNHCILNMTRCNEETEWQIVELNECEENIQGNVQDNRCPNICPEVPLHPICAFAGNEYKLFLNECQFLKENCRQNSLGKDKWRQTSIGNCNDVFDRSLKSNCNKPCPHIYYPICAFNGEKHQIFGNKCIFEVANCYENNRWRTTSNENCADLI